MVTLRTSGNKINNSSRNNNNININNNNNKAVIENNKVDFEQIIFVGMNLL